MNRDIMIAVKNAKTLLSAGYTFDEIKDTIEYCVSNPPPKGIYSFGYIISQVGRVTTMLKTQNKKIANTQALDKNMFNDYGLGKTDNKDKIKQREIKVDTSIFD